MDPAVAPPAELREFLLPVADYVASFVGDLRHDPLEVTAVVLDMPCELSVAVSPQGVEGLLAAPPTQHLTTGVMPVFHRLRLRIEPLP